MQNAAEPIRRVISTTGITVCGGRASSPDWTGETPVLHQLNENDLVGQTTSLRWYGKLDLVGAIANALTEL